MGRLSHTVRAALAAGRSIVFAFEGWDAAGKGGAIRRLTSAIDPRDYSVIPVAKPTPEEKHAHYLWRFWRDIPSTCGAASEPCRAVLPSSCTWISRAVP